MPGFPLIFCPSHLPFPRWPQLLESQTVQGNEVTVGK